jgi:tetratricopeptide (TPR) repeat protein
VTPQLIRVSDDTHLWTSRFDAALDPGDLFRVQSQIAEQVAQALDLRVFADERSAAKRRPTEDAEAYEYYLRGLDLWNRGVLGFADNDRLLAIEMYERAVAHDPDFALAYARLAGAHSWAFSAYLDRSEARLASAEAAAQRALELDPELPEAMVALGWIHVSRSRDYDRAIDFFQRSLEVDANHVDALYGMAWVAQRRGNLDRALELFQRRLELDPLSSHAVLNVGTLFLTLRQYEDAERYYDRAVTLAPDLYLPYARQAQLYLIWRGDSQRAQAVLRDAAQKIGPAEFIVRFANDWRPLIRSLSDEYRETLENLSQSSFGADTGRYHILKAMIHAQRDDGHSAGVHYDSVRVFLENRIAIWPDNPEYHSELGLAYAGLGRVEEAVQEGQRAVVLAHDIGNVQQANDRMQDLAEVYVLAGRFDGAIDQIVTLLNTASRVSVPLLQVDPLWNPLRSNPRFSKLLQGS